MKPSTSIMIDSAGEGRMGRLVSAPSAVPASADSACSAIAAASSPREGSSETPSSSPHTTASAAKAEVTTSAASSPAATSLDGDPTAVAEIARCWSGSVSSRLLADQARSGTSRTAVSVRAVTS
ncbi:hypothetical protein ACFQGX_25165 [Nonomuraea dietziae]|uniref:hypothetical protein n=1 Tax=Nonomuraea dietziae TaxID=65515 RepID=UPI00360BE4A3